MFKIHQIIIFIPLICSCDYFQYSPHAIDFDESQTNLNEKNIQKLMEIVADDTIRFVITGDSQEAVDELHELVESVNSLRDIDFVILAGDLTQKGAAKEYKWMQRELALLNVPYIAVVGNHDLERNGEHLFRAMFGELDFTFSYKGTKFICLNNNSYIYDNDGSVPNIGWLEKEMETSSSVENIVVVSHIPPTWAPQFDPKLVIGYRQALLNNSKTLLSAHAHASSFDFSQKYQDGIDYLTVPGINNDPTTPEDKSYVVGTIVGTNFSYEKIPY